MSIRDATEDDVPPILEIFNHEVAHSSAMWIERPSTIEERLAWLLQRRAQGFPVLVVEEEGRVLGYGSFAQFRPYDGFRNTVEHSLYIARDAQGRGHGRAMLGALIDRARAMGKRVMIAAIDSENEGSIRLHEHAGFTRCGLVPGVGEKFGRRLDMVLMRRDL